MRWSPYPRVQSGRYRRRSPPPPIDSYIAYDAVETGSGQAINVSEFNFNMFSYMASTDGQNLRGEEISGDSQGWVDFSFDLCDPAGAGDLCGKPEVWVGFIMESDGSINFERAFVDDVVIHKQITAARSSDRGRLPDTLELRPAELRRR